MPIRYSQKQQEDIKVGDIVERDIDGILFPAKILGIRRTDCKDYRSPITYDLKYLDDNNCEDEVPEDEIRRVLDERKRENLVRLSAAKPEDDASGGVDDGSEGSLPTEAEDKTTGDVWDGIESSGATVVGPKVTIHSSHGTFDAEEDGSATAYIINGPETNIAAGSGLRGIRWLRG